MKLLILGPKHSGKDETANIVDSWTPLIYKGSTSAVIAPWAAEELGVSEAEAWATKEAHRALWYNVGNDLRRVHGPLFLVTTLLSAGATIIAGLRGKEELHLCASQRLFDMVFWIDRKGCDDATLEFTEADTIEAFGAEGIPVIRVDNNGTPADLRDRVLHLCNLFLRPDRHVSDTSHKECPECGVHYTVEWKVRPHVTKPDCCPFCGTVLTNGSWFEPFE